MAQLEFSLLQSVILFGHFTALYGSHSKSKNGLYFPNFVYFSKLFSQFFWYIIPNVKVKVASQNPK